ncbi:Uncharacterized protein YydD, contains DUF2326 domain [Bryocella elongata]|uniref:Uncharacterized protein YydD, contains DUF2326 domain n=1 Tax=Bryocella elongata TaxID=863522 RepID=A0A1H5XN47_9BACT|nr:ABC-three component system protein [Bryocella elongata]SEG12925.1 Uncharacterized protein YydD, contains DUF2326 domain [Bryocella elongata]
MIYRIYSSLPSFKQLEFGPGLNVLLADKESKAKSKQTRNGAGKSSTLEIIHFVCAGECDKDSIFKMPELAGHRFGLEFDLGGQVVRAERSGSEPGDVIVNASSFGDWPVKPELSEEKQEWILNVKSWDRVLGHFMFGLDASAKRGQSAYAPTFRSLFPYFVRREPGGFSKPYLYFLQSKPVQWQVAVSFLLGLDWTIPQDWQKVRDSEDSIKKLKAAVGEGDLAEVVGKKAELRAEIASKSKELAKFQSRISGFQVLPDFREYEQRAGELTNELSRLSADNTLDDELILDLETAIEDEHTPQISELEKVYKEAGLVLPGVALRAFNDVKLFHESVVLNRKSYLNSEIQAARQRIASRERRKASLDAERQACFGLLSSHGALEQFLKLQAEYGKKVAELDLLQRRFAAAEQIEEGLAKAKIRRQQLLLRLQQDYSEQADQLNKVIVTFQEISSELYEKPALFTPSETTNGPTFNVEVQGERSPGIGHMQIYTFDMMLCQLAASKGLGPGFLVHDSHLFDPVDSRQVGAALALGQRFAAAYNVQYIVTFNSDKEIEYPRGFDVTPFHVPTKLTDATLTGGLFGIRFA